MREIKFRTWNPTGKEMNQVRQVEYFGGTGFYDQSNDNENNIWMQWTGLQDKNGVDIYEGDICDDGSGNKAVVKWTQDHCQFLWWHWAGLQELGEWAEVVGNIYEHPDLLGRQATDSTE